MYALFKDGKQISKVHKNIQSAWIEAFEQKVVLIFYGDFHYEQCVRLEKGYSIEEVGE